MHKIFLAAILVLALSGCNDTPEVSQERLVDLKPLIDSARVTYAPSALRYLEAALDTLEAHHVYGPNYDWEELRLAALERTEGAQTREETYEAILFALRDLDDPHTYFIPPKRDTTVSERPDRPRRTRSDTTRALPSRQVNLEAQLIDGSIAYIEIPRFTATDTLAAQEYVNAMHDLIREMEEGDPCGWIVDLRRNTGGNMWPMLAGIGPLLGAEHVGSFVDRDGSPIPWYYADGKALMNATVLAQVEGEPYLPVDSLRPVAVLTSKHTGSSGEAVVAAFKGRPNTRSFGHATAGAATAHEGFQLTDGALLGFSVVYYADRKGHVYDGPIPPDVTVESEMWENPEEAKEAAMSWLKDLPECRETSSY